MAGVGSRAYLLRADGTVYGWGANYAHQAPSGDMTVDVHTPVRVGCP